MIPNSVPWPIFRNVPVNLGSWIVRSWLTHEIKARISDPVASVPMNESTRMTTTTIALSKPMASAAPSEITTASPSGTPATTSFASSTPAKVAVYAVDRSKTPALSGISKLSASIATTALPLRICFAVAQVGNVSGTQIEKITMITSNT